MVYSSPGSFGLGNQTRIPRYADPGYPGLIKQLIKSDPYVNLAAGGNTSFLVAIGTTADSTNYSFTAYGRTVTVNSGTSSTAANTQTLLIAAIKADSILAGRFTVAPTTTTTFTVTDRVYNNPSVASVSGGGTGYAITPTTVSGATQIPYGRMLITKATYPKGNMPFTGLGVSEIPSVSLPTASSDIEAGISIASHALPRLGLDPFSTSGARANDLIAALTQGSIWVQAESAIARGNTMYYRNAANGALTLLGAFAGASGTGLVAPTKFAVIPDDDSTTLYDGTIIVPVSINRIA